MAVTQENSILDKLNYRNQNINKIRLELNKSLVIVIYFFDTEMCNAVIINYWLLLYSYSTGKNSSQIIGLALIM